MSQLFGDKGIYTRDKLLKMDLTYCQCNPLNNGKNLIMTSLILYLFKTTVHCSTANVLAGLCVTLLCSASSSKRHVEHLLPLQYSSTRSHNKFAKLSIRFLAALLQKRAMIVKRKLLDAGYATHHVPAMQFCTTKRML